MKVTTVNLTYKPNEWHHLTPLGDLHVEAASFDKAAFKKLTAERNELPNHRYIGIGDMTNGIANGDKRYTPSVPTARLASCDAYANETVRILSELFEECGVWFDSFGIGNHETSFIKYSNSDIAQFLCDEKGWTPGGYEGRVKYRMKLADGSASIDFNVLYHHGAWGGRLAKGFNGAQHYAFRNRDWDVFCYGHNHQMVHHVESVDCMTQTGAATDKKTVHIVCCGTHYGEQEERRGVLPSYEKIRGMTPSVIGAPLIKWRVISTNTVKRRKACMPTRMLEVKVEMG